MRFLIADTSKILWQEVIKYAETRCCIELDENLEFYLISLLIRYTDKPEVARQIFAKTFLEAMHLDEIQRQLSLRVVGDECLLSAGLFPKSAARRHVKISYFVQLGQSAYAAISQQTDDLFNALAIQFVPMMDVLQSIRETSDLLPIEAYDQWNELGSQRALQILKNYSSAFPAKKK